INTIDPKNRDRAQSRYYATSTPMIFIIDKDEKIRLKKLPAENLGPVMDQLFEEDRQREIKESGAGR
ncbi:MAG: hypothetical protein AAFR14_12400, partial [Bacteroidota bacterium]